MTEEVIVTINEGKIRGLKTKSAYSGVEYYSFLGVPYGQSTAGEARFKDPVKKEPWKNILNATVEKKGCTQFSFKTKEIVGSEDCLYNNIFTPKIPSRGDPLKAVIFNIHGGGLHFGSPDPSHIGPPDFIMHRDVVYVSVAYRLHILGFLNLDLDECSGNQCFKDIILSLQWVKENISTFGGDPNNVTLVGQSSGSVIAHFLLLSPLAKGLYHKAILMGGYVFNPLMVTMDEQISIADGLARKFGYNDEKKNTTKLLQFYKKLDLRRLFEEKLHHYFSDTTMPLSPIYPFMASRDPRENSPLPSSPERLIPTMNRVPSIIGFSQREAIHSLAVLHTRKTSFAERFHKCLTQNRWGWGANLNDDELTFVEKQVKSFYLNGEPLETATQPTTCDILTDVGLSDVYDSTINIISADHPVYVYNFKYDGELCSTKFIFQRLLPEPLKGAFHSADVSYWNCYEELKDKGIEYIQPEDQKTIERLTSFFISFAKTGNPNYEGIEVTWKPTTQDHPHHLIIDETLEAKDGLLNGERMQFWHDLKNKIKQGCVNIS